MIGEAQFALMPMGSFLINASRGPIVDQQALLLSLSSRRLAGAALDVLRVEPPTSASPAPQGPTLVVTPHSAWYTLEAEERANRQAILSVRTALSGVRPPNSLT